MKKLLILCFASFLFPNNIWAQHNILSINTDKIENNIDINIYGLFLEDFAHSVTDGLYAEKIRGRGFEGNDFNKFWQFAVPDGGEGKCSIIEDEKESINGKKSILIRVKKGTVKICQKRLYIQKGFEYDGSIWLKKVGNSAPQISLRFKTSKNNLVQDIPINITDSGWKKYKYSFKSTHTDTNATIEIVAKNQGAFQIDYLSLMRTDERNENKLRKDLFQAIDALKPSFIRWPGGSFVTNYDWKPAIGDEIKRNYTRNFWGFYYYNGFGTDEFIELCRLLNTEPLIVFNTIGGNKNNIKDKKTMGTYLESGLDWIHYLNDPPETRWGKLRTQNGRLEPYNVVYFQYDNEPMNYGLSADQYAETINYWGPHVRKSVPNAKLFACGQKRSYDIEYSKTVIDKAGKYFDYIAVHNYVYDTNAYCSGINRIESYLHNLKDYIAKSDYKDKKIAVLEWGLQQPIDWRSGLHAAGMYILFERLSPTIQFCCPAVLLRRINEGKWGKDAIINHTHYSWYPSASYVVAKLFREHYAKYRLASIKENYLDAIATISEDGKKIIIKAVNYHNSKQELKVKIKSAKIPKSGKMHLNTISAGLNENNSFEKPDAIKPTIETLPFKSNFKISIKPYSIILIEIDGQIK